MNFYFCKASISSVICSKKGFAASCKAHTGGYNCLLCTGFSGAENRTLGNMRFYRKVIIGIGNNICVLILQ